MATIINDVVAKSSAEEMLKQLNFLIADHKALLTNFNTHTHTVAGNPPDAGFVTSSNQTTAITLLK